MSEPSKLARATADLFCLNWGLTAEERNDLEAALDAFAAEAVDRLRGELRQLAKVVLAYCDNCDREHLSGCQFCREDPAFCPNELRDDYYVMRETARSAEQP